MTLINMVLEARDDSQYLPYPDSLFSLPETLKVGLPILGTIAVLSLVSTFALFGWITYRLISWRQHYKAYVGYNQYVLLIYNLVLADLWQALAFFVSFYWVHVGKIVSPHPACFVQGWFLHIGDVASGSFVMAIAIHTWLGVVRGYKMVYKWFVIWIVIIWIFAAFLASIGPIMYTDDFFARAGAWCWVSQHHEDDRLWLHYIWIFIFEFGTMLIYAHIFFHLRGRLTNIVSHDQATTNKLKKSTQYMVLYPLVYVVLTLPLAVGRMATMGGAHPPDAYYIVAGSLLTSCGFLDVLLYTITRRVLVSNELTDRGGPRSGTGPRGHPNSTISGTQTGWDLTSLDNRDPIGTAHSVTITGGKRISTLHSHRGRNDGRPMVTTITESQEPLRTPSPTESTDSIAKLNPGLGMRLADITVEHKVEVEYIQKDDARSIPDSTRGSAEMRKKSSSSSDSDSLYQKAI